MPIFWLLFVIICYCRNYFELLYLRVFTHYHACTNRARSVRMMFRPKRVISDLYPTTRGRSGSSSFPAPSNTKNSGDGEVPEPRSTLKVPSSPFALPSRAPSVSPIPDRKRHRTFNITANDPSRTPPPTPSLSTIAHNNFKPNSCFVNSSIVTPRKIVVCIGLLVFSAMHVRTITK